MPFYSTLRQEPQKFERLQKRANAGRLARVPPILHPISLERRYTRDLFKSFTLLFDLQRERLEPQLSQLFRAAGRELESQRFDAFPDDLAAIIAGIEVEFGRKLTQNEVSNLAKAHGRTVADWNRNQNDKVHRQVLKVDVFRSEPNLAAVLDTFAEENVRLISSLSQKHLAGVQSIVTQGVRQGFTVAEIQKRLSSLVGKTEANLRLIARDQTSKLNGQLTRLRQQDAGIKRYKWRTSRDERVRHTHRVKEGVIFSWDDPPTDTGHPGEDYQCRCYAEPIFEDLFAEDPSGVG